MRQALVTLAAFVGGRGSITHGERCSATRHWLGVVDRRDSRLLPTRVCGADR